MPTRGEIQERILSEKSKGQDLVRREYLRALRDHTGRDTILYASAFTSKKLPEIPGYVISITKEDLEGWMAALHGLKGKALDLILHSPGGSADAADQVVQYLRAKYEDIRVIVPHSAMSAATMIACSADRILMGKHSALGPIDPQLTFSSEQGHTTVAAQSVLDEFERAKLEVGQNPALAALWAGKIRGYPPGLLASCQSAIDHSVSKVQEWLATYMLRNDPDRDSKSKCIAEWLGNAREHKSHGRPIGIQQARAQGIVVDLLEDSQELQEKVLSVFHAAMLTFEVSPCMKFIENHEKGWYVSLAIQAVPVR